MYADNITKSMHKAIDETNRRRKIQEEHNNKNNIVPTTIIKEVRDITEKLKESNSYEEKEQYKIENISDKNIHKLIKDLEKEMKNSAKVLEFEKAALIRDQISELRKNLE